MNQLHEKFGLNPSHEVCKYCRDQGALVFQGDNIPGQAPEEVLIDCPGRCVAQNLVVFIEKKGEHETGYVVCGTFNELKHIVSAPGTHFLTVSQMKALMHSGYRKPGTNEI